jgi:hypothetical protein
MVDEASFWHEVCHGTQFCSTIWSIPGFCIQQCRPDFMHSCCLGILQYLQGNVIYELFIYLGGSFANWQSTCSILENMMRSASKDLNVQPPFNRLTVGMFRANASKAPKLKLKAAEGRHFLPVLKHMLAQHFPLESDHERLRYQCLDSLHDVYLQLNNWVAGGPSAVKIGQHGRKHLLLYSELSKRSANPLLWRLYPKHHQFVHVVESARVNPKLEWNYAEEDAIGNAAELARACHPLYVCTKLLARYRASFRFNC